MRWRGTCSATPRAVRAPPCAARTSSMVSRVLAAALLACSAQAAELEGVRLEDRAQVDGQALELNGIGLRTRMFFKVYVAGLYLPQKISSAQTAIEGQGAKRIVLVMMRDASADQFCESVEIGLEANHSEAELERIQSQTQALFAKIRAIGEARKGMRIVLDYSPSAAATTLFVDGVAQGGPMPGSGFFRVFLRRLVVDRARPRWAGGARRAPRSALKAGPGRGCGAPPPSLPERRGGGGASGPVPRGRARPPRPGKPECPRASRSPARTSTARCCASGSATS